ncbi:hypothetical protein B296_00010879 [Ensete ventricosum]|uniref:Uncharacterized protein n=1 Tax=Ensete ventricosum TaxID=4639 RepID=A0A427B1J3_ENSVE|nr:hypothetical protein B296_00010879 [Ensete ventricosum]
MRKPKFSGELTVMEGATHQPSLGVCTRARATAAAAAARDSSLSYLELRSRRLEKPPSPASKPRDPAKVTPKSNPSSKLCSQKAGRVPTSNSGSLGSARMRSGSENDEDAPPDVEVSFGENVLEPESRERPRFAISTCTARYRRYIPVRQVVGTWTSRYRAVSPKIDRWRSIEGEIDRRRSIEGEKEKKKRKKRKEEYLFPRAILVGASSLLAGRQCSRVIVACGSQVLFLPREETERLPAQGERLR